MSLSASQTPNMSRKFTSKSSSLSAGAIDEDVFYNYFQNIFAKEIESSKELQDFVNEINTGLNTKGEDWERKVKSLKLFQSIIENGQNLDDFLQIIRQINLSMQNSLSDLRSQVVREACLTVGYLAHMVKIRAEIFIDLLIPPLLSLIQNSAKVMSSSANVCLGIIITNIPSAKILQQILTAMSSKSNITRRTVSRHLETLVSQWDISVVEKQLSSLTTVLDKGSADADQETRASCRRAFVSFSMMFPRAASQLLGTMDAGRRSLLEKQLMSNPGAAAAMNLTEEGGGGSLVNAEPVRRTSMSGAAPQMGTLSSRRRYPSAAASPADEDTRFGSLNRPRIITQINRPTNRIRSNSNANIMSTSVIKDTSESKQFRGSNSSLTNYRSSAKNTPKSIRKTSLVTNPTTTNGNNSTTTYKYGSSGSVSASLPRRKNIRSNSKTNIYPSSKDSNNGSYGTYQRDRSISRRRNDYYDDNNSETSSIESSDISKLSSRAQRPTENIIEILKQLSSSFWSEKKDGLINLQNFLQIGRLSPTEVKKFVESLNLLFNDNKSKLFPLFLSTVQLLVETHNKYLHDWLFPLIMNLLSKYASETISSRQKAIQDTLAVIRTQFPLELVLRDSCKALADNYSNTTGLKLKLAVLTYLKTVLIVMPTAGLEQSLSILTPTLNILVEWSVESKWQDVRKASQVVISKLHEIHPMILQDASQCLSIQVRQRLGNLIGLNNVTRDGYAKRKVSAGSISRSRQNSGSVQQYGGSATGGSSTLSGADGSEDIDSYIKRNTEDLQALSIGYDRYDSSNAKRTPGAYNKSRMPNFRQQMSDPPSGNHFYNNNQSDSSSYMIGRYQSSLRNVGLEHTPSPPPPNNNNLGLSNSASNILDGSSPQSNHYQGLTNNNHNGGSGGQRPILLAQSGLLQEPILVGYSNYYNPGGYNIDPSVLPNNYGSYFPGGVSISIPTTISNTSSLQDTTVYSVPLAGVPGLEMCLQNPNSVGYKLLQKLSEMPPDDMMLAILTELCSINQHNEQRKVCLMKLIFSIRENSLSNWSDLFKTMLMRLLETVKDNDPEIRSMALRAVQELTKLLPESFEEYTHLTILRVLQTHRDLDKNVVKSAEECCQVLAKYLSNELCVRVLAEMINELDCRINLGALKMLLEVLKSCNETQLIAALNEIIPGLIRTSEHEESHIRKASIFCLVEIHRRIGENIWNFLSSLPSTKARLLKLYIDKNRNNRMTESSTTASESNS